jgi:cytochrome c oxidase subunit II
MFSGYSNFSQGVDTTFAIIIGISLFFLIGITAVIISFIFRFNRKKNPVATEIEGSNRLEIIWTVIPLILVLFMFWLGWHSYIPERRIPKDAMKVKVTAQMWSWRFEYANGLTEDTLYIPANRAVALDMTSIDVIHSLYIPAFRVKEDVVPGKENKMWFESAVPGSYDLFCAEYCGLRHSYMGTMVKVVDQAAFDKWYAAGAAAPVDTTVPAKPGAAGKLLVEKKGCIACHSADGSKLVGPSYKGIFGHKVQVETNGKDREVLVDEEYLKRAILDPNADAVKGFPKGSMPDYKTQLSADEVDQIIEYIKTLSGEEKEH